MEMLIVCHNTHSCSACSEILLVACGGHRKGIFKNLLGWLCETDTFTAKMGGFGCKAALMCILWTDTLLRSFPEEQAA